MRLALEERKYISGAEERRALEKVVAMYENMFEKIYPGTAECFDATVDKVIDELLHSTDSDSSEVGSSATEQQHVVDETESRKRKSSGVEEVTSTQQEQASKKAQTQEAHESNTESNTRRLLSFTKFTDHGNLRLSSLISFPG